MIRLTKTKTTEWAGNGFGTNTAEWVVAGQEHIAVRKLGINWFAVDTSEYAIIDGRKVTKKIAKADTKSGLVAVLAAKLS